MSELKAIDLEKVSGGERIWDNDGGVIRIRNRYIRQWYRELSEEQKKECNQLGSREEKDKYLLLSQGFEL